jgi:hypothetical protein
MLDSGTPVQIIDTRPRHSSSRAQDMMEGAVWRDLRYAHWGAYRMDAGLAMTAEHRRCAC